MSGSDNFLPADKVFTDWVVVSPLINELRTSGENTGNDKLKIITLSGMAVLGNRLATSGSSVVSSLDEIMTTSGQFTCVGDTPRGTVLINDFYGFQTIFYYEGPSAKGRIFAASNRFVSLSRYLIDHGAFLTINEPYVANQFYSDQSFFQQFYAHQTACRQIKILPVDSYLSISDATATILKKPLFQRIFNKEGNYDSWMDMAAEKILQDSKVVFESMGDAIVKQALSGGRDSRLALGVVLKAGFSDRIRIHTEDVPSIPDDLRISTALVEKYKLKWYEGDDREQYAITFDQGLKIWSHYQSNLYHRVGFATHASGGSNANDIEMTGGGGEVFRSFWSPSVKRRGITEKSPDSDMAKFHKYLVKTEIMPPKVREEAEYLFLNQLSTLPGESPLEKSDNHYLYFRNRTHFGGSDLRRYLGNMTWHPIASPYLLAASRVINSERREDAEVLYDLQERFIPELNDFEFDSKPWSFRNGKEVRTHNVPVGVGDIESWKLSVERRRAKDGATRAKQSALFRYGDVPKYLAEGIQSSVKILYNRTGSEVFGSSFEQMWADVISAGSRQAFELTSKLQSCLSVFDPQSVRTHGFQLIEVGGSQHPK